MADFFYRESSVSQPAGNRIRNNAWVTVTGEGFALPVDTSGMKSTYNPNGTGRPAAILKSVKVELKGEAGSLRHAEVSFVCFDKTSFDNAEKSLLLPGKTVTVAYGYVGPESPSDGGSHEFRVFDYSFKITKENYFDCSFKAVGKGGTYGKLDLFGKGKWPAKKFITNYDGFNDKIKVASLFDYVDYQIQNSSGQGDSKGFDPGHGTSGKLKDGSGYYGCLKAPEEYNPPTKIGGGWFESDYIQYISFGAIIKMINKHMLEHIDDPKHKLALKPSYSNIQTGFPDGLVWSADPVMMLFPYAAGTKENDYSDKAGKSGGSEDMISVNSFKGYIPRLTKNVDSPDKILLGRDLLRTIAQSFSDDALTVTAADKDDPDKANGGMPLDKLMKKIFATIKENSGGAWDLYLDQDEDDPVNIWIINRRSPGDGAPVKVLMLDPISGTNGIRELSIAGKVPKDIAAKAFGAAPEVEAAVATVNEDEIEETDKEPVISVKEQQVNARKGLQDGDYATKSITTAKAAVKALVNNISSAERSKKGQYDDGPGDFSQVPFPLEFSVTLDGVEGFKFGDTIGSNYLPTRYVKASGGPKVVFTVTSYTHTISNNDWTTDVTALSRIR